MPRSRCGSPPTRTSARVVERQRWGIRRRYEAYLAEILRRDAADSGREVAPLRQADDALVLDTGVTDVDTCVEAIVARLEATTDA